MYFVIVMIHLWFWNKSKTLKNKIKKNLNRFGNGIWHYSFCKWMKTSNYFISKMHWLGTNFISSFLSQFTLVSYREQQIVSLSAIWLGLLVGKMYYLAQRNVLIAVSKVSQAKVSHSQLSWYDRRPKSVIPWKQLSYHERRSCFYLSYHESRKLWLNLISLALLYLLAVHI